MMMFYLCISLPNISLVSTPFFLLFSSLSSSYVMIATSSWSSCMSCQKSSWIEHSFASLFRRLGTNASSPFLFKMRVSDLIILIIITRKEVSGRKSLADVPLVLNHSILKNVLMIEHNVYQTKNLFLFTFSGSDNQRIEHSFALSFGYVYPAFHVWFFFSTSASCWSMTKK